jgi:hypothetical protein
MANVPRGGGSLSGASAQSARNPKRFYPHFKSDDQSARRRTQEEPGIIPAGEKL